MHALRENEWARLWTERTVKGSGAIRFLLLLLILVCSYKLFYSTDPPNSRLVCDGPFVPPKLCCTSLADAAQLVVDAFSARAGWLSGILVNGSKLANVSKDSGDPRAELVGSVKKGSMSSVSPHSLLSRSSCFCVPLCIFPFSQPVPWQLNATSSSLRKKINIPLSIHDKLHQVLSPTTPFAPPRCYPLWSYLLFPFISARPPVFYLLSPHANFRFHFVRDWSLRLTWFWGDVVTAFLLACLQCSCILDLWSSLISSSVRTWEFIAHSQPWPLLIVSSSLSVFPFVSLSSPCIPGWCSMCVVCAGVSVLCNTHLHSWWR